LSAGPRSLFCTLRSVEQIVDPEAPDPAGHPIVHTDADAAERRRKRLMVLVAEIVIERLALHRPVAGEHVFKPAARSPAGTPARAGPIISSGIAGTPVNVQERIPHFRVSQAAGGIDH